LKIPKWSHAVKLGNKKTVRSVFTYSSSEVDPVQSLHTDKPETVAFSGTLSNGSPLSGLSAVSRNCGWSSSSKSEDPSNCKDPDYLQRLPILLHQ
jgi:hypothetical protein